MQYKITSIIQIKSKLNLFQTDIEYKSISCSEDVDKLIILAQSKVKKYMKTLNNVIVSGHTTTVWRQTYVGNWAVVGGEG